MCRLAQALPSQLAAAVFRVATRPDQAVLHRPVDEAEALQMVEVALMQDRQQQQAKMFRG